MEGGRNIKIMKYRQKDQKLYFLILKHVLHLLVVQQRPNKYNFPENQLCFISKNLKVVAILHSKIQPMMLKMAGNKSMAKQFRKSVLNFKLN